MSDQPVVRISIVDGVEVREEWHGPALHGKLGPLEAATVCGIPIIKRLNRKPVVTTYFPGFVKCPACLARMRAEGLVLPGAGW